MAGWSVETIAGTTDVPPVVWILCAIPVPLLVGLGVLRIRALTVDMHTRLARAVTVQGVGAASQPSLNRLDARDVPAVRFTAHDGVEREVPLAVRPSRIPKAR